MILHQKGNGWMIFLALIVCHTAAAQVQGIVSDASDRMLGGAVAGVHVTQVSGQPGAGASVRIRGGNSITAANDPLYVIDGFIIRNLPRFQTESMILSGIDSDSKQNQ
jgi:hypothetical protein